VTSLTLNNSEPFEHDLITMEDYEQFVGEKTCERILAKAELLADRHVTHLNATYYGGGVAALLSSFILLMNSVGIRTGWRVLQGSPDFFSITKKMHNALQGGEINLTEQKKRIYEEVVFENAIRNHIDHDVVLIHDPQVLPIIRHYLRRGPWIWRCHIDMTKPHSELWEYLTTFVEMYDAVILSLPEYKQKLSTPQRFIMPAIDPFSLTNKELTDEEVDERLSRYNIPTDLPIVTQISRFDKWKDPRGVIEAFKQARKDVDATLVLLGNVATDDPEGEEVFESLLDCREERILIKSIQDTALVNALQRKAAVVVQKSIREGFGLTVTEAMWKGTPVIGGNVGGIKHQIVDGENGFLVNDVDETAQRLVELLKDDGRRATMGEKARKTVQDKFLMSRYLEDYLDLILSFETCFRIKK